MLLRSTWWSIYAALASILFAGISASPAGAARRHRGRSNAATSTSAYVKRIAPKRDADASKLRLLKVSYDYDLARSEGVEYRGSIKVFLRITDESVLAADGRVIAEVKFTDLSNYHVNKAVVVPVSIDRSAEGALKPATFEIRNDPTNNRLVEPAKVYRLFINLRHKNEKGEMSAPLGCVRGPYYAATSGETRLERARHQIVMRTFKEFYYRQRGWRTGEKYPMDCYSYYMWATGFCTVGAKNGRTQLASLFGGDILYNDGQDIPKLDGENPIHGDYVRKPGHSFMLLAYDPQLKHVWTMEGNFNSTIEVVVRSISSSWKVGHLRDRHIRAGLFEQLADKLRPRD